MHNKEAVEMMNFAAEEIEALRRTIERLQPKADAYDTLRSVIGLLPQTSQGYGIDIAWKLRKRAGELVEEDSAEVGRAGDNQVA